MKNFLLFNQSFGTVGSPNQTGETLTRENRIGLMSYLRRTLMLLFAVLTLSMANIGMAWGASVTFSAAEIAAQTKKGVIQPNCSTAKASKQLYKDGSTSKKFDCIPISSSMGTSDTQTNAIDKKNILFTADAGYQITGITIVGASNSSSTAKEVVLCWTGDISNNPASFQQITLVGYEGTSMPTGVSVPSIPSGTKSFGLYIKVKVDNATTPTALYTGSGCKDYGAGNSQNVYTVTVTYEAAPSGKNIYLKPNGIWDKDGARFAAYYFKSAGDGNGWVDFASYNACTPCFKATIPSGYDKVILCRMDGSKAANNWDNRWNQTDNQTVPTGNDTCFTISSINGCTDGKSCGSWGTYTAPTYTISFDGNGSTSGSTASHTGISCNGSQTLRANGFSRTGWTFTGWNTSAYGDGDAYAAGATISSITSDITLYAQWSKVMYVRATGDLSWW